MSLSHLAIAIPSHRSALNLYKFTCNYGDGESSSLDCENILQLRDYLAPILERLTQKLVGNHVRGSISLFTSFGENLTIVGFLKDLDHYWSAASHGAVQKTWTETELEDHFRSTLLPGVSRFVSSRV